MSILVPAEEFPTTPAVISHMRPAAVVTETVLPSGIKLVSRNTGAPVRIFSHLNINYIDHDIDTLSEFILQQLF